MWAAKMTVLFCCENKVVSVRKVLKTGHGNKNLGLMTRKTNIVICRVSFQVTKTTSHFLE
jgi:hypothetical protein